MENRIEELEFALELEKKKNLLKKKKIQQYQHQQQQQLPTVAVAVVNANDDAVVSDCKRMLDSLEIAKKERDDALDLVREIRKLMVKN